MPKVKLTKGELKRQRDALRQYQRYLPTLQLKKQQLQIEIQHQTVILKEKERARNKKREEIEEWAGDDIKLVLLVASIYESIGILVFQNEITMDMVDAVYSGPIDLAWKKLETYVSEVREAHQRETLFEWFQWLAERMRDRESSAPPVPAHIAHREWKE